MILRKIFLRIHNFQYRILSIKARYYKILFSSCGSGLKIWGRCYIKNPQNIKLGKNVSINDGAYLNGLGGIEVGDDVSISAAAVIVSTSLNPDDLISSKHVNKIIKIGRNVQVGAGAIILPGVEIGSNVMIGAGTVVTKNVESNCIVVGNPARLLRRLNDL